MSLDSSIILGVKPLELKTPDPIDRYVKLAGVQEITGKLADQERARADEQAVREAYQQSGGDSATLRKLLTGRGAYKQIQALDKAEGERAQAAATTARNTAQAGKADFEVKVQKLQHGAALLNEARDAESFERALVVGEQNGIFDPKVTAQWRQQGYSPQLVQALKAGGITEAQRLEEEGRRITRVETERSHRANEAGVIRGQNLVNARAGQTLAAGRVPSGYRANPDGSLSFIPGGPADPSVSGNKTGSTEDERKAAGWLAQATNAYNNMARAMADAPGSEGPGWLEAGLSTIPITGETMAGAARPQARQRFVQAASSFAEAALRAATGAGVNETEARQKIAELTPVLSDSPTTRQQKLDSMKVYLDSLQARAGRAVASTPIPERSTMPAVAGSPRKQAAPTPGAGVNPSNLSDAELRRELGL